MSREIEVYSKKEGEPNIVLETFIVSVERISGINTEIGLSRVSGMKDMYREVREELSKIFHVEDDSLRIKSGLSVKKALTNMQVWLMPFALGTWR